MTRAGGRSCSWPSAPTSTAAATPTRSWRACWAPTTSSSGRCAATSCAARSSCPRERAGLRVEPDLVDALIADVEGQPGALPLLSTSLLELWQQRDGRRLRLSAYRQTGGVHGAVARLAERAYERLDPERAGRRAADPAAPRGRGGGRRRRAPARAPGRARAARASPRSSPSWPTSAWSRSARARSRSPTRRCCASGRACASWLEEDAQGRHLHQQLSAAAREWDAGGRDPGELYRGARLAAALDWSRGHEPELNATERAFLDDEPVPRASAPSAACAPTLAGVAALLVLALIAGVVALRAARQPRASRRPRPRRSGSAPAPSPRPAWTARCCSPARPSCSTTRCRRAGTSAPRCSRARPRSACCAATARACRRSRSAPTSARSPPAIPPATSSSSTRGRGDASPPSGRGSANSWIAAAGLQPGRQPISRSPMTSREGNVVTVLDTAGRRVRREDDIAARTGSSRACGTRRTGTTLDVIAATLEPDGRAGSAHALRCALRPPAARSRGRRPPPRLASAGHERCGPLVTAGDGEVTISDAGTLRAAERFAVRGSTASENAYALSPDDRTVADRRRGGAVRILDLAQRSGARSVRPPRRRGVGGRLHARRPHPRHRGRGRRGHRLGRRAGHSPRDAVRARRRHLLAADDAGRARRSTAPASTAPCSSGISAALAASAGRSPPAPAAAPGSSQSSDGRLLATGQEDGAISIVDAHTLERRATFPVVDTGAVRSIGFVPGSHILVVGGDGEDGLPGARRRGLGTGDPAPARATAGRSTCRASAPTGACSPPATTTAPCGSGPCPTGAPLGSAALRPPDLQLAAQPGRPLAQRRARRPGLRERRRGDLGPAQSPPRPQPAAPTGRSRTRFSPDSTAAHRRHPHRGTRVWSTETWKPVTRSLAADATGDPGRGGQPRRAHARHRPQLEAPCGCGTSRPSRRSAHRSRACPATRRHRSSRATAPGSSPATATVARTCGTCVPERLLRQACQVAGRRLTRAEWAQFLPGRDYDPAC